MAKKKVKNVSSPHIMRIPVSEDVKREIHDETTFSEVFLKDIEIYNDTTTGESANRLDIYFPKIKKLLEQGGVYNQFRRQLLGGTMIESMFKNFSVASYVGLGETWFSITNYFGNNIVKIEYDLSSEGVLISECYNVPEGCSILKWSDILICPDYEEVSTNSWRYSNTRSPKPQILQIELAETNETVFYDVKRKLITGTLTPDKTRVVNSITDPDDICKDNDLYANKCLVEESQGINTKLLWFSIIDNEWIQGDSTNDITGVCHNLWDSAFTEKGSDLTLYKKFLFSSKAKNCCNGTVGCSLGVKLIDKTTGRTQKDIHAIKNIVPLTYDEYNRRYCADYNIEYYSI